MMGLWADGWFYISSAGLLISGMLFFFLLGQYRIASEAADAEDGGHVEKEAAAATHETIRPVYIPDEPASAPRVISHREPEPRVEPEPKPERKDKETTTGGISPAVVYLQNIKGELADLHKDVRSLAKRVDDELASVSTRDEALIERLTELTRAVEAMKAAAPAPAPAPAAETPAPKKVRKEKPAEPAPEPEPIALVVPEPAPAPVVVVPEPKTEPAVEPARTVEETIRTELGALIAQQVETKTPVTEPVAAAEPEPTPEAPVPEEKPRRGPVWPV